MIDIPELDDCNTWVVVANGESVPRFETGNRAILERLNPDKCKVWATSDWLREINRREGLNQRTRR